MHTLVLIPLSLAAEPSPLLPAVIVVLEDAERVPEDLSARGRHLGGPSWLVPEVDPEQATARWLALPEVRLAEPDRLMPMDRRFDDPSYGGQWYLEELGAEALFAISMGNPETRVAVLDSAIEIAHPDLIEGVVAPYDAVDDDEDPSPNPGEYCQGSSTDLCDSHGTSVSGVIAARADNGIGVVGICAECSLVPVKLLGERDGGLSASIAAFEHAIEQDVAVINNSWGYVESIPVPSTLADVIHRAATETRGGLGSVVVFAAGNDDREIQDNELQALDDVLCVSALDSYGNKTNYTNYGRSVDVSAPSATVTLTIEGGVTTTFGGTSAAAPVVSGVAAWILAEHPELSAAEVRQLLIDTAVPSPLVQADEDGFHEIFGYGVIDLEGVLAALYPDTGSGSEARPATGCACSGAVGWSPGWLALLGLLGLSRRR